MIASALIAMASQVAAQAVDPAMTSERVREAGRAIEAGRLDQARLMIANGLANGAKGPKIDRLLADLAYASGNYAEAVARYRTLIATKSDAVACERGGISAIRVGDRRDAATMIACAMKTDKPSWRAWNARGVLADSNDDWQAADEAYGKAAALAPTQAAIPNNQGWSMVLRGDWGRAVERFERAADLDPTSSRIANNLELARAAVAGDLPRRHPGESTADFAKRLNDAGVAAEIMGDQSRAVAAFTQALEASGTWYARAANNLDAVKTR